MDGASITADKVKIPRKWDDSFSAFNGVVQQDVYKRQLVLAVDDLLDGVHKVVVIQHHGVDVEHLGDVLAGFCQCLFVQGGLLLNGCLLYTSRCV